MLTDKQRRRIVAYYRKPESVWGYRHFLWGSKHFGYYPNKAADISERQAQELLQDEVASRLKLKKGLRVLDAGCGEGVVAVYLAKRYAVQVNGVTLVPFEARMARKRARDNGVTDTTSFEVMDYTNTTYASNCFDAIFTTETLSHIPEPLEALKEFLRLLKPGGRLAMFEYTLAADDKFLPSDMKILDFVVEESGMFGFKKIRHGQLVDLIAEAGFIEVQQENVTEHIVPSFERLNRAALRPYNLIRKLGLRKVFINTTASVEYFNLAKKDLIRYYIFTAEKPSIRKQHSSKPRNAFRGFGATKH